MNKFSLQLHSVRDALENDYKGTLKRIADMGYEGVEFASNYGDMPISELKEYLDYLGLAAVSMHVQLETLENDFDKVADTAHALDCSYIICPWANMENAAQAEAVGKRLAAISEKCALAGLLFGYHNHTHEFAKDGQSDEFLFDIMMHNAGELVLAQLDVCWVGFNGNDIEAVIRKYAGKVNLLHLKQFIKGSTEKKLSTLDKGEIDFTPIIKTAKLMGTEHFIIELDTPVTDSLTDAKTSIDFAKTIKA